ncbi:MAG: hypothetical protein JO257_37025 [Deltaproteobacteria bacterium]|nr:hypothetical protein [Deltaproteobacteria bacterium]
MRTLLLLLAFTATAAADPFPVANPSDFHWKPKEALPPGATGAVLRGDPTKGDYDFVAKFPAKYTVPLHSHTNECIVVMRKGAMTIGRTGEKDVTIDEGGLFVLPAKMVYTAHCTAACEFLVHGTAPFDILYADPKDDPRTKKH